MVYVLNKQGQPLMPTTRYRHVRMLLREGLAVVVRKDVFTIQLTYESTNETQAFTLGVDCGAKHIGLSATNDRIEAFAAHDVRVERTPSKLRHVRCCGKTLVYQRYKSTLICESPAKLKT